MKTLKVMLAAALTLGTAVSMMAQSNATEFPKSYNIASIGYDHNIIKYDYEGVSENTNTNGVTLQYINGINIMSTTPLYLEYGVRASLGFYSKSETEDGEKIESKITTLGLTIPVNVAYQYNVTEAISVTPYTGLHLKANVLGKGKNTVEYDGEKETSKWDCLKKDDMGGDAWKRVQFGWQIGARVAYGKYNLGLEYGIDFNELCKNCKTSNFMVTLGMNF